MDQSTFDKLFTTPRLQMLKVLLPCLPPDRQGGLAVYIKLQELLYTAQAVQKNAGGLCAPLGPPPSADLLCDRLLPYCSDPQKERLSQFRQMSRQMESMKDMMETMRMMQELFPEGMNAENMDLSQVMAMFGGSGAAEKPFPGFDSQPPEKPCADGTFPDFTPKQTDAGVPAKGENLYGSVDGRRSGKGDTEGKTGISRPDDGGRPGRGSETDDEPDAPPS